LTSNFPVGTGPKALVARDFDLDGTQDVATTTNSFTNLDGKITVLLGNRMWGFRPAAEFPVRSPQTPAKSPGAIITADFNRDGKPDLATPRTSLLEISTAISCWI